MSRIGKQPIPLTDKVNVEIKPNSVVVKNSNTEMHILTHGHVAVSQEGNELLVKRNDDTQQSRAYHGLYRSLIGNAVHGVTTGWSKTLVLNGVGYRASLKGTSLELTLGYSHPISYPLPDGITAKVDKQTKITVTGADKALVGQVAAKIRGFRPPEPFLGKGVKYEDEYIRRKAGKSGAK